MPTDTTSSELTVGRLTLVFISLSTGISVITCSFAIFFVEATDVRLRFMVVPFTLMTILPHFVIFRHIARHLVQINKALNHLRDNKNLSVLHFSKADIFYPISDALNVLIRERLDLKTMRGQLVEQISATAAQEERNRLARDLHDSIKQQVFSMSVSASAAYAHLENNPLAAREAMLDVKQSAQEAMVEMRALLQQLSPAPLEKSGLIQALRDQCEALAYRTGAKIETRFGDLPPDDRLPIGTQEALFRITQEALSNIARHARTRHVLLSLEANEAQALVLHITDDGQGFDTTQMPDGMGLKNMQTRTTNIGASVNLTSQVGEGTQLTVTIPLIQTILEEEFMKTQYDTQVQPVTNLYMLFAGAVTVFVVTLSMFMWRLLDRPDGITEDPVLVVIMLGLFITILLSLPTSLLVWFRARRQTQAIVENTGRGSYSTYKLRRYIHFASLVISLAIGWFLPVLAIGLGTDEWLRVFIGVAFLAIALWQYRQMSQTYKRELSFMNVSQRLEELEIRLTEIRNSWVTVGLSSVFIVVSALWNVNIQIPPQNPDHWMSVSFITVAILLIANQFVSRYTYQNWREATIQERFSV